MLEVLRRSFALHPPRALRLRLLRWMAASAAREFSWALLLCALVLLAALVALGALGSGAGMVVVVVLAGAAVWLARLTWQSFASARSVRAVLADLEPPADQARSAFPLSQLLVPPLMLRPRGVAHRRGIEFARPDGRALRLDVYEPATPATGPRPAIVQVHGGGWIVGSRSEQGIPLLNHLAVHGWVGFNVDYRLSPAATFPDHVVDVKRAIAWVREHADSFGIDPEMVAITGGSAGGHLCALAALTANDPEYQPGFEEADTSVAAAVPFYGVYDLTDPGGVYYDELLDWVLERQVFKARLADRPDLFRRASPTHRVHPDAPAFCVLHGDRDTLVPVADARAFVAALRAVSRQPVVYGELAGAEHAFDILPSVRTARVAETIERFLATVRARRSALASAAPIG